MTNHEIIKQAYSKLPEPDTFKDKKISILVWSRISETNALSLETQFIVTFYKGSATAGGCFWCFDYVEKIDF